MTTPPSAIVPDLSLQNKDNNYSEKKQDTNLKNNNDDGKYNTTLVNDISSSILRYKLPDIIDPIDIGLQILEEEDDDGAITRCFTEKMPRYYNNFATAKCVVDSQEIPVVQIHYTYMLPLITMSPDIFMSANINCVEFDVEWDINEDDNYIIGYCFIMSDNKLCFLSKNMSRRIFTESEYIEIKKILQLRYWSPVLGNSPILEEDTDIIITQKHLQNILDKRNGYIRHTTVQAPVDLSGLLNEYISASTLYHVSKIDKERRINDIIQSGEAQILDHTNLDDGWALVHKLCIGQPKWDIIPYPKMNEWDEYELRYKELRTKLRIAQIKQNVLKKFEDGSILGQITPEYRYHIIFLGVEYNNPLGLRNFAIEHIKFIQSVLSDNRLGIGIANFRISVSRLYERLMYDKVCEKSDYYIQNPITYGWHPQLSRVARIHHIDLVSINNGVSDSDNLDDKLRHNKASNTVNITRECQSTAFIIWFK